LRGSLQIRKKTGEFCDANVSLTGDYDKKMKRQKNEAAYRDAAF
jgi:hypothetical protein